MFFPRMALVLLFCMGIMGEETKNKIAVNLFPLFYYDIQNLEWERAFLKQKLGVALSLSRTGFVAPLVSDERKYVSEEMVRVRYFLRSFGVPSPWGGAGIAVGSANVYRSDIAEGRINNLGYLTLRSQAGFQFVHKGFYIDPFVSAGFILWHNLFGESVYEGDYKKETLVLDYGLLIGMAF